MIVQDRLNRLQSRTHTEEDLNWAIEVLTKYYNRKRSKYEKSKQSHGVIVEEDPTVIIRKVSDHLKIYIAGSLAVLESYGDPIATCNKGKYYVLRELSAVDRNRAAKFSRGHGRPTKLEYGALDEVYSKIDFSRTKIEDYSHKRESFWIL